MTITKTLYNYYAENAAELTDCKERAFEAMEAAMPHKEFCEVEENLNAWNDAECERAFEAGFKAAIQMFVEVLS